MGNTSNGVRSKGAAIRDSVQRHEYRVPRHIRHEEIAAMPRLRFVKGCESGIFISRERDESRFYSQGLCFHDADMDDLTWEGVSWDEAFYCMKGQLKIVVTDAEGNQAEYIVDEGDHFWGPAGYKYTMKATGVESINFWTTAPVLFTGWSDTGDAQGPAYHQMLLDGRLGSKKSNQERKD